MVRLRVFVGVVALFALVVPALAQRPASKSALTDAQIREVLVRQSIASYSGSCPCPFNRDRAGRSCGRRSAYSRPGGASPMCYAEDVSQKAVDAYRASREGRKPAAK
jgi:hypothetical protein